MMTFQIILSLLLSFVLGAASTVALFIYFA